MHTKSKVRVTSEAIFKSIRNSHDIHSRLLWNKFPTNTFLATWVLYFCGITGCCWCSCKNHGGHGMKEIVAVDKVH